MTAPPIVAWAVRQTADYGLVLFLSRDRADEFAAQHMGRVRITLIEDQPSQATPAVAWAVRGPGGVSLHSDEQRAMRFAVAIHATVRPLIEHRPHRNQPRQPQGEMTPGGLIRL